VKVIMTTALNDSKHCIAAFREGCESYVAKPIVEDQLLAQMQVLLGPLPPKAANRASHCEASEASAADQATAGGGRFLIVDDDPVCRELLRDLLRSRGACDVAYDGQEAIEAIRLSLEDGRPYDLVCLDIMMPGTDGHDALRSIRQVEEEFGRLGSDGVKVIMTTALSESKHCIAAFKEGCESYITKPIREDELFRAMDELGVLTCGSF
jgi:two-component system chemotaxis response regulator CheY